MTASSITATSATISWTAGGSENEWELYCTNDVLYVPDETTIPTQSGLSARSYNLTGLTSGTTYCVYVRAACSGTEKSGWSMCCTFNTDCAAIALPYSYDFSGLTFPLCWSTIVSNTFIGFPVQHSKLAS